MKDCIATLTPAFSTARMVADYIEDYYLTAHGLSESMLGAGLAEAQALADQIRRWRDHWRHVEIFEVESDAAQTVPIRSAVSVRARVRLGGLRPDEVHVQIYHGEVTSLGDLIDAATDEMHHVDDADTGSPDVHEFRGQFRAEGSGLRGFAVRVVPRDRRLIGTLVPGLITWDHANGNLQEEAPAPAPKPQPAGA
jgi:starch phosphorylase